MTQPTIDPTKPYREILGLYLEGKLSTDRFRERYDDIFLNDQTIFEAALYEILNELFTDAESLTSDPELLAEGSAFYLDEKQFREKAELAAARLAHWRSGHGVPG
jgi:hypothetical protein